MRDFPWLEAALFIAMAVALIVKPNKQPSPVETAPMQTASVSYQSLLSR